jgi:hypothetical protein
VTGGLVAAAESTVLVSRPERGTYSVCLSLGVSIVSQLVNIIKNSEINHTYSFHYSDYI